MRISDSDYIKAFGKPEPPLSDVPAIRAAMRHSHVYTLAEEGPSQKLDTMRSLSVGSLVCCGQAHNVTVMGHDDIAVLAKSGLLGPTVSNHVLHKSAGMPLFVKLFGWSCICGVALWRLRAYRTRWIKQRIDIRKKRLARFRQDSDAMEKLRINSSRAI